MRFDDLLMPRPEGLYCPAGDFYVDPVRPVDRALVTHGHADHARPGNRAVLATSRTLDIMEIRYGANFCESRQVAAWGKPIRIGDATVSFHPAGHVLGSAQIRIETGGAVFVVSGDYKRRADPSCEAFEPVTCDVFVTEATFGLPVFRHPPTAEEIGKLTRSLLRNPDRAHLVGAYSLGKAQRVIRELRETGYDAPIHIHGALAKLCAYYQDQGIDLGALEQATLARGKAGNFAGSVILGPPSAFADRWGQRFPDPIPIFASGWMRVRQRARQRGVELPLILSDHADWDELTATLRELRPEETWVTHGREDALIRWCCLNQMKARPLHLVGYDDEAE